jgi:hypothetical protein
VQDPLRFNNVADWSVSNVVSGALCARVNVSGTALSTDLGNNDSQTYTFEWVCINNVGSEVMVMDTSVIINNAVQV